MKTEDREDFNEIKSAILRSDFEPIARHGFNASDYDKGVVCAKMPKPFSVNGLLQVIDRYTRGNSGAIISPDPFCGADKNEQWIIMPTAAAAALKANLRTNSPKKSTNREEACEPAARYL